MLRYTIILASLRDQDTIASGESRSPMDQEAILAALSASEEEAKSLKEIVQAMSLDISSYINWIRIERRLSSL
jgi:hypothetical protein